jgi:hypothetical protein
MNPHFIKIEARCVGKWEIWKGRKATLTGRFRYDLIIDDGFFNTIYIPRWSIFNRTVGIFYPIKFTPHVLNIHD